MSLTRLPIYSPLETDTLSPDSESTMSHGPTIIDAIEQWECSMLLSLDLHYQDFRLHFNRLFSALLVDIYEPEEDSLVQYDNCRDFGMHAAAEWVTQSTISDDFSQDPDGASVASGNGTHLDGPPSLTLRNTGRDQSILRSNFPTSPTSSNMARPQRNASDCESKPVAPKQEASDRSLKKQSPEHLPMPKDEVRPLNFHPAQQIHRQYTGLVNIAPLCILELHKSGIG